MGQGGGGPRAGGGATTAGGIGPAQRALDRLRARGAPGGITTIARQVAQNARRGRRGRPRAIVR